MLRAAVSAVAHSPLAGGLSHDTDLGAIRWICDVVMAVSLAATRAGAVLPVPENSRESRRALILTRILSNMENGDKGINRNNGEREKVDTK